MLECDSLWSRILEKTYLIEEVFTSIASEC